MTTASCLLSLLVLAATAATQQPVIHVAVTGDDAADGSAQSPVRSLARARDLLREHRAARHGAGGDVLLHAGVHRLDAPLQFGPDDGGGPEHVVRWRSAGGEHAIVSGGRELRGFAAQPDGTWTLALPNELHALRELFVGDMRRPRARTPNDGYLRIDKAAADRRTGFTFPAGELQPLGPDDAAELLFLHDWCVSRVPVRGIDAVTSLLTTAAPIGHPMAQFAIDNFEPHPRYRLENARSCLDRPGEWCVDAHGTLRYLPLPGEDVATFAPVAPLATGLVRVRGDAARPVQNLRFEVLDFEHCAFLLPSGGFAEAQANFHEVRGATPAASGGLGGRMPAAIEFEHATGCWLTAVRVAHVGGAGVSFGSRCESCRLDRSTVEDVSGNGVMVGETGDRQVAGRPWTAEAPEQVATANEVRGCAIVHCGVQFGGAVGVWVGLARATVIAQNEIAHLPYSGVSLGWRWDPEPSPARDNRVEQNEIHHVMQLLSDGGGIYTLGLQPGTMLVGNRIHDVPANAGRAESNGMFLDEGTTSITIAANTIWNTDRASLRFHRAGKNTVRDNVLVVRGESGPVTFNSTNAQDIAFEGNTVARELPARF